MYSPFNEEFMLMDARERAERMRGLRGDRATRRATAQPQGRGSRGTSAMAMRRWWHKAAALAG